LVGMFWAGLLNARAGNRAGCDSKNLASEP
jgi:hypothetical protein